MKVYRKDFIQKDGWVVWFWPSVMFTNIPSFVIHATFSIRAFPRLLFDLGCQLFFVYVGLMVSIKRSHKEEPEAP